MTTTTQPATNSATAPAFCQEVLSFFRASLPVVALDNPSAEEQNSIEKLMRYVAGPLNARLFVFDLGRLLQEVKLAVSWGYRLEDGTEWEYEVDEEDGVFYTKGRNRRRLTRYEAQANGIKYESVGANLGRDPLIGITDYVRNFGEDDENKPRAIFIFLDVHPFFAEGSAVMSFDFRRSVKNLAFGLKASHKRLILMGQGVRTPDDWGGLVYTLHNDLPTTQELGTLINRGITDLVSVFATINRTLTVNLTPEQTDRLLKKMQGLSGEEALNILRLDAIKRGSLDEQTIEMASQFKVEKLKRMGVELCEPPDVAPGGSEVFMEWVEENAGTFNLPANPNRKLKIKPPKGVMLVGPSGTGKTLLAKMLGQSWVLPILKVDMGSLKGSLVGESENNLRNMLKLADQCAPCILLLDEVEKMLAGANGPDTDSGTSKAMFGQFLTWLNDHTSPVFVVATSNNLDALPPEFKRKGRFDEIFFVDLPNQADRKAILKNHLANNQVELPDTALEQLATLSADFVGAELGYVVERAAKRAFREGLDTIESRHLAEVIAATTPYAKGQPHQIQALREWAENNAVNASHKVEDAPAPARRQSPPSGAYNLLN